MSRGTPGCPCWRMASLALWGADLRRPRRPARSPAACAGGACSSWTQRAADVRPLDVHFCEEYPTPDNLERASLLRFPALVFLAAVDPAAFEDARRRLRECNPSLSAAWWPVLPRSLTLSALAEAEEIDELERMLRDAEGPLTVLLDLELPLWDRSKMLRLFGRPSARRRAARALDRLFATALARHLVWTAEYPPLLPAWLSRSLRLELRAPTAARVYMLYSSLLPRWWRPLLVRRVAARLTERGGAIGVGVLATGIAGDEPILSPERLSRDLAEAAQIGAGSVVVYRLGGLAPAHASRIELWQRPGLSAVRDA